jgi:hypothetical protein
VFRRRMSVRGSKIFIPDLDLDFLPNPDLGFRGQKVPDRGPGSATLKRKDCVRRRMSVRGSWSKKYRIPDPDLEH